MAFQRSHMRMAHPDNDGSKKDNMAVEDPLVDSVQLDTSQNKTEVGMSLSLKHFYFLNLIRNVLKLLPSLWKPNQFKATKWFT